MTQSQTTGRVLMIAPAGFGVNPQTAATNAFQASRAGGNLAGAARRETLAAAACLRAAGIDVLLFDDTERPHTPDAVFCNNWFSTHADGSAVLYPMATPNRRAERRVDLLRRAATARGLLLSGTHDLSAMECRGEYLEGTGSLVMDHRERVAYAAWSPRTSPEAARRLAELLGYRLYGFDTDGPEGRPVYHANVMLSVGERFVLVCAAAIRPESRVGMLHQLAAGGRELIEISASQMACFAGNVLQLDGARGPIVALSGTALAALDAGQRRRLATHGRLVAMDIPTIELGGGSVRCMLGEIFLPTRSAGTSG